MAIKELQTRIALKYDSYSAWIDESITDKGANLKLLKGEIGICEIPSTTKSFIENGKTVTVETAPTVLFKVGAENADGTLKTFKELPWASAKAADVYDWAKKTEAEFKTWLDETAKFATDAEVEAAIKAAKEALEAADSALEARIKTLEDHVGGGENGDGVDGILEDHETRIQVVEAAVADTANATQAELNAYKEEVTDKFETIDGEIEELTAADAALSGRIDAIYKVEGETKSGALATEIVRATEAETTLGERIDDVIEAYQDADDQVKTDLIGEDADTTQAKTIAGAKAFATAAVAALAAGKVAENAAAISAMDKAYQAADTELDSRLDTVEAKLANVSNVMDFIGARTVSEAEGVITVTAVDNETFNKGDVVVDNVGKEYVYDGEAWHEFGYADANTASIKGLQGRMNTAESEIDTLQADILTKADKEAFETYQTTVGNTYATKTTVEGIEGRLSTAEGTIKDKLDASEFTTFKTNTYDVDVKAFQDKDAELVAKDSELAGLITNITKTGGEIDTKIAKLTADGGAVKANADAIADLEEAISKLDDTYVSEDEFEEFKTANTGVISGVNTTATNAAAAASAVAGRVDAYDTYFGVANGVFPTTLIFNCGSSTEVIE